MYIRLELAVLLPQPFYPSRDGNCMLSTFIYLPKEPKFMYFVKTYSILEYSSFVQFLEGKI